MDETRIVNRAELRGTVSRGPVFSHESRGEKFFSFPLEVQRLSGTCDVLNIIAREELLTALDITECEKLHVTGEVRSFNNKSGEGSRLVITIFAREIEFDSGGDMNLVELTGAICKLPNLRTTPMGREICDLILAVNRRYGRSDYLPCIAWGLKAKEAADWSIGTHISINGRMQSRQYIKNTDNGPVEKTAYEVSITDITEIVY